MKHRIRKLTSLLLSLSLISALTLPAAASNALGEDLSAKDTLLHQETQLSTNVFWSTTYSDLRTENLITYTPNKAVTPIVTYGDALTDRSSVADMAALLEEDGYRVVAGINGDFYNVSTGLPIGMVVTEGLLRSSDAGYYAIGFRADGSAILGKPGVKVSANLGYAVDDGFGNSTELVRPVAAVNKARTNSGLYLYTYDFNAKHTTGTTEPGINAVCTVEQGKLAIGSTVTLRVDRVEETAVTSLAPDQIVLSANLQADSYYTTALQNIPQGSELTLTVSANDGWEDVEYAIGALYCLAGKRSCGPQPGRREQSPHRRGPEGGRHFDLLHHRRPQDRLFHWRVSDAGGRAASGSWAADGSVSGRRRLNQSGGDNAGFHNGHHHQPSLRDRAQGHKSGVFSGLRPRQRRS